MSDARFRIAPLAFATPIDTLEAWIDAARAGDSTVYATGPALPHGHPSVKRVQVLADRGVLRPHLMRRRDGKGFDFLATRLPDPPPVAGVAVARDAGGKGARVLAALTARAEARDVMHSNAELARACGLKNADEASYQIRKLIAAQVIRVEDFGPLERRAVTIIATGATTRRGRL